jgi:hypothetical protein
VTTCTALYEPWQLRRQATHDCKLPPNHDGPHVCSLCGRTWSEPATIPKDLATND